MFRKLIQAFIIFSLLVSLSSAAVVVNETFDDYADDAAMEAAWAPSTGSTLGLLVPRPDGDPNVPPAPYDGSEDLSVTPPVQALTGKAVAFGGDPAIHQYNDSFSLVPTAAEPVRISADIFDFAEGNRRFSVGLRNNSPSNLIELGHWQAAVNDPTGGGNPDPVTGYAYRLSLFAEFGGDLVEQPNWQYFQLPIEFDSDTEDHNGDGRMGNADGIVDSVDVGPGWHTYSATVTDTDVTLELDLFRDGTVDSSVTWEMTATTAGFNDLRFGGPSGSSSLMATMVDNIVLETLMMTEGIPGDYNNDGIVSAGDLNLVLSSWGSSDVPAAWVNDLPNGVISAEELNGVLSNWGNFAGPNAVPEPSSLGFAFVCFGLLLCRRTARLAS